MHCGSPVWGAQDLLAREEAVTVRDEEVDAIMTKVLQDSDDADVKFRKREAEAWLR